MHFWFGQIIYYYLGQLLGEIYIGETLIKVITAFGMRQIDIDESYLAFLEKNISIKIIIIV